MKRARRRLPLLSHNHTHATRQTPLRPKLDFLTTPGYLTGPSAREQAGLPANTGPHLVITQLAVMGFDLTSKRMKLISVHPGVTVDDVQQDTGFQLIIPDTVSTTEPPSANELKLLREEIDPAGIIIR